MRPSLGHCTPPPGLPHLGVIGRLSTRQQVRRQRLARSDRRGGIASPGREPGGDELLLRSLTMGQHRDSDTPLPPGAEPSRRLTDREKVVRAFMREGRLVSIPAKPSKRDVLLPVILDRCFPEDRPYDENEVNLRLAVLHPDVAALRRYLVDGGLMTRRAGVYRRTRAIASVEPDGRRTQG
jgi:hypothetical protein